MMKNRYQKLTESIPVPAGLNDRVLFEARRRSAEPAPRRGRRPAVFRTAVCAACALALVLGRRPRRERPRPRFWCPPSA